MGLKDIDMARQFTHLGSLNNPKNKLETGFSHSLSAMPTVYSMMQNMKC